jgi:uncharacterized alkaline shock family protein YloU
VDEGESLGSISVHDDVVAAVAAWTAINVEGVAGLVVGSRGRARGTVWSEFSPAAVRAARLDHGPDGLALNVDIAVRYGTAIRVVAERVADEVRRTAREWLSLSPARITVNVVGVVMDDSPPP